jgi:hypothetical protein
VSTDHTEALLRALVNDLDMDAEKHTMRRSHEGSEDYHWGRSDAYMDASKRLLAILDPPATDRGGK